jgi:DNA-binding MarR family transcriptional regulator
MAKRGTTTETVRQFAAAQGLVRKKQIQDLLGLSLDQVKRSVKMLVDQGYLRRLGYGSYEFVEGRETAKEAPVDDRIWRAMRINPTWSATDIAVQAGSTRDYIYKVLRRYEADGFVKPAGQRAKPDGSREKLWRITMKGHGKVERPRMKEFRPDPLVEMTVKLNRLVCTGLAMREEEHARSAIELCGGIVEKLEAWFGETKPQAGTGREDDSSLSGAMASEDRVGADPGMDQQDYREVAST